MRSLFGKFNRRSRLTGAVTVLSLATVLTVASGVGVANAAVSGPLVPMGGGLSVQSSASSQVSCDALAHTISPWVDIVDVGWVSSQEWVYSYQFGKWFPGAVTTLYDNGTLPLTYGAQRVPPGQYYVEMRFGFYMPTGWVYAWDPVGAYNQFGTGFPHGVGTPTCTA